MRKLRRTIDKEFEGLKEAINAAREEGRAEGYAQGRDEVTKAAEVATRALQQDHDRAMRELREQAVKEKNCALEAMETQVRNELGLYSLRVDRNEACLIYLEQRSKGLPDYEELWREYQEFVRKIVQ